jgi:hypothetical protein
LKKSVLDEHGNVAEAQGDLVTSLEFKARADGYTIKHICLEDIANDAGPDIEGKMDDNDRLWIYIGVEAEFGGSFGRDRWYEFGFKDGKLGYHGSEFDDLFVTSDRETLKWVGRSYSSLQGNDMGYADWTIELTEVFSESHIPLYFGEEDVDPNNEIPDISVSVALV